MRLLADVEADGFLEDLTQLWCIVAHDLDSGEWFEFGPDELDEGCEMLEEADELIGHNFRRYDVPAIQKVRPSFKPRGVVICTQVLSRLCWPDVAPVGFENEETGKKDWEVHSMRAWGHRLGFAKEGIGIDFSVWDPQILVRCRSDVEVNRLLLEKLVEEGVLSWEQR